MSPVLRLAMLKTQAELRITHHPRVIRSNYGSQRPKTYRDVNFISFQTQPATTLDNSSTRPEILRQIATHGRSSLETVRVKSSARK